MSRDRKSYRSTMGDLFGGIGLLLYGIRMLGNALAQLAGSRAERELAALHNSPVAAFAAGTAECTCAGWRPTGG